MIDKVIEIELLPADRVVTRPVHQWDIGQIIKVTDAEIEDGTPVDFGNRFMKGGLRAYMLGNEVTIPAPALQQERDLTAYVVVTDENSETTVKEIFIPVIPRPKPEDYVDEEIRESTEFQYVILTVAEVEANAERAEEAAKNAAGSETAAGNAATAAGNAATAAANSASAAKTSETNANGSATTAAEKATEAANSASAAKTHETNAEDSATAAANSASAAKAAWDSGEKAMRDIDETIETALEKAKASGEFNGPQGEKGEKGDKGDTGEVDYTRLENYYPKTGGDIEGNVIIKGGKLSIGQYEDDGFAKILIAADYTEEEIETIKNLGIPAIMKDAEYGDLYITAKPTITIIADEDWIYAGGGCAGISAELDGESSGVEANGDRVRLHAGNTEHFNEGIEVGPTTTAVRNLVDPSEDGDAVPKRYIDNLTLGGGGGSVDWADIQNKPFGDGLVTLVDNQTITLYDGQGMIEPFVELLLGEEYTVIYNGTEYKSTAIAMTVEGIGSGIAIGNGAIFGGENTGEPFIIGYMNSMTLLAVADGSSEVVLTVIGEEVRKIDAKYIPESTCFYADSEGTGSYYLFSDEALTQKVTAAELLAAKDNVKIKITRTYNDVPMFCYAVPFAVVDSVAAYGFAMCGVMESFTANGEVSRWFFSSEFATE